MVTLPTGSGSLLAKTRVHAKRRFLNPKGFSDCKRFLISGDVNSSAIDGQGIDGDYWSSTANNSDNARNLNFDPNNVNPAVNNDNDKYNGLTVRCMIGL